LFVIEYYKIFKRAVVEEEVKVEVKEVFIF